MKFRIIVLLLHLILFSSMLYASPYSLVDDANGYLKAKKYKEAEAAYKKADNQKPETPEIIFNLGNLYYHKKDFDKAIEYFTKASVKGDKKIENEAMFRIGNSYFKKAENLIDADLREAIENFKKSISFYQDILKNEPENNNAKINIQRARLIIKDLLDKLKKQQEEQKKQGNDKNKQDEQKNQNPNYKKNNDKQKENKKNPDENKNNKGQNKEKDKQQQPKEQKSNPKKMDPEQAMKQLKKLQEEDKKKMKKFEDMQVNGVIRGEEWW